MLLMAARVPSVLMQISSTFAQALFNLDYMFNFYGKPHPHPRAGKNSFKPAFGRGVKTYPTPTDTSYMRPDHSNMAIVAYYDHILEPPGFDATVAHCSAFPMLGARSIDSLDSFRQPVAAWPTA